ncbi:MAG: phosphotransferase [Phycisphaeraceae bacterium]
MLNTVEYESPINVEKLAAYLARVLGADVRVNAVRRLGGSKDAGDEKVFGYGVPLRIDYEARGIHQCAVLHTMKSNVFGHQHRSDRAAILLWSHETFNRLPRHVRSINVGAFDNLGDLIPLHEIDEVFLLTDYVEGREYGHDLVRLREGGEPSRLDLERCDVLADYLLEIHAKRGGEPSLYTRRIRDLVGHGECIMGLIDSYPRDHPWIAPPLLQHIEELAVKWRWRLRDRVHRIAQVHGDFHPWNILFDEGTSLHVLDRSRGEWGDPADDVSSLAINYVFESVQLHGNLGGVFASLFERFWGRYRAGLSAREAEELLEVAPPFIAWRTLVLASPVWYPQISDDNRRALFRLIENVLQVERFEPERINEYLGA